MDLKHANAITTIDTEVVGNHAKYKHTVFGILPP